MAEDPLLLELRNWRLATSRSSGIRPYDVFDNVTLSEIGRIRPSTSASLEAVRGMGPVRVKRWGSEILRLVSKHPRGESKSIRTSIQAHSAASNAEITARCENELRARRFEQATREKIPAFHIFSDAVLRRLARARPKDNGDLSRIPDVGAWTIENHGRWILAITRKYPAVSAEN